MKTLKPVHTSFETAYIVVNYPYGFRLKTEARFWIETNKKGQRLIFQTLNPKNGKYNTPKKGNYYEAGCLFLDDEGHVHFDGFYNSSKAGEFLAKYEGGFLPYHEGKLWIFKALHEAQNQTGKTIYGGHREEIWEKAKQLLTDWGKEDLIKKIQF